jgi:hypothetical protein
MLYYVIVIKKFKIIVQFAQRIKIQICDKLHTRSLLIKNVFKNSQRKYLELLNSGSNWRYIIALFT